MHIAADIFSRGLIFAALVVALGSPISIWLSDSRDAVQCAALAPLFGLSLSTAVATTALWFAPAVDTAWLLPAAAVCAVVLSIALLHRRARESGWWRSAARQTARATAGLLALGIVVALPTVSAFVAQHSVGPVGYQIGDSEGYVAEIDGMEHQSIPQAVVAATAPHAEVNNLTKLYWDGYAANVQEIDAAPFIADVDSLLGVGATSTQSSFLMLVLVVGALGIFACVPRSTRTNSRVAALAASALFGGCMFMQLLFDGSEGALLGLAVLVPLVTFLADFGRWHRAADVMATSLLIAAVLAFYPLFVPAIAVGIVAAYLMPFIVQLVRHQVRPQLGRRFRALVGRSCLAVAIAAGINWYDAVRAVRYWHSVASGAFNGAALPNYAFLRLSTVPGWLLQTVGLYQLPNLSYAEVPVVLAVVVVPIALLAVAAVGTRAGRPQIASAVVVLASTAIGVYETKLRSCSYCEDRSLLPAVPLLVYLCATGFVLLWAVRRIAVRMAVCGITAGWILSAGFMAAKNLSRFQTGSYFLDTTARVLLQQVPRRGDVELEGFNLGPIPSMEQGFVYAAAEEQAWNRVSLVGDHNQESSLVYLGGGTFTVRDAVFKPRYRYVLTRLPNVRTDRRILAEGTGIALEERRIGRPDVTVDFGLTVPPSREDQAGVAAVGPTGGMRFVVTGAKKPGFVLSLTFAGPSAHYVVSAAVPGVEDTSTSAQLHVCIPLRMSRDPQVIDLRVQPTQAVTLLAMRVVAKTCTDIGVPRP